MKFRIRLAPSVVKQVSYDKEKQVVIGLQTPFQTACMETVKIFWTVIFFFFSLILLFVWSKMYLVSRKLQMLSGLIDELKTLSGELNPDQEAAVTGKKV